MTTGTLIKHSRFAHALFSRPLLVVVVSLNRAAFPRLENLVTSSTFSPIGSPRQIVPHLFPSRSLALLRPISHDSFPTTGEMIALESQFSGANERGDIVGRNGEIASSRSNLLHIHRASQWRNLVATRVARPPM